MRNGRHMTAKTIENLLNECAECQIYQGHPTTVSIEGQTKGDSDNEKDDEGGEGELGEAHRDLLATLGLCGMALMASYMCREM